MTDWEVRAWSYATLKHRRREHERIGKMLRKRRKRASVYQFARLDAEQMCLAITAPAEEIEQTVKIVRPNGRSIVLARGERDALVARRGVATANLPPGEDSLTITHDGDSYLSADGRVRKGWPSE